MKRRPLKPNQVWISQKAGTRTKTRRIVEILDGRIFYSTGTPHVRSCARAIFRLWIRTYRARCAIPGRKRVLVLPQGAVR